jgi:hypothetical protein
VFDRKKTKNLKILGIVFSLMRPNARYTKNKIRLSFFLKKNFFLAMQKIFILQKNVLYYKEQ